MSKYFNKKKMNNFYFDLGVGTGDTVHEFLEGRMVPLTKSVENYYIFGYEPYPRNPHLSQELKEKYPNTPIELSESAVWIEDENHSFTCYPNKDGNTLIPDCINHYERVEQENEVSCINFSKVLLTNCKLEDEVIVKMDIEGAEFPVLEHLIETEAMNLITRLFVEFHTDHMTDNPVSFYKEWEKSLRDRFPIVIEDWR